jgi:hypothetical protein
MHRLRRRTWGFPAAALLAALSIGALQARAADQAFPFGAELMLDSDPLYGSKRVPMIEIDDDGVTSIDLWCASAHAQATVGANSITIVAEPPDEAQCSAERQSGDENLLSALSQATNWRRDGEIVELSGATTLRFRLMTN